MKYEYLGNKNDLICIHKGDIIFGAEGTFRSFVAVDEIENMITNIHGITLNQVSHNISKGIFVKLFLDYYRSKDMIAAYAVGGNGGSLAIKYWEYLKIPNFPKEKEQEIVALYHNAKAKYISDKCTLDSFLAYDKIFNQEAGIYELDKSMKYLQEKLNKAIGNIVNDIEVKIEF